MSSIRPIRSALQVAIAAMSPGLITAWENDDAFTPTAGLPYQQVQMDFAKPGDDEIGNGAYVQQGLCQITLCYPTAGAARAAGHPEYVGTGAAEARAEMIRAAFARGTSLTAGGVVVTVSKTPEVMSPSVEDDRYRIPVRIPFMAQL